MTENSVFDLADVIAGRKIVCELTREENYYHFTKHYYPKDQNSLFKKQCIKRGETKNLTYQLSRIQNKPWHVYNKELQGKICVLLDQNSGPKPRGKFVEALFQYVGKSEKYPNMKPKSTIKMP